MKKFLGTILLLAFLAGTTFMTFGCGKKDSGEKKEDGNGGPIPAAQEKQKIMDEVLDEG